MIRAHALVLTRNLPPLVGGMERLVWHIVDGLRADYRVHVIGPVGSKAHLPPDVAASEVSLKPLFWFFLRTQPARGAILHPGVELPDMTDAPRQRAAFREELTSPATPKQRTAHVRFAENFDWRTFGDRLRQLANVGQDAPS